MSDLSSGSPAIRFASTVVITRPGEAGLEVYMVRRSAQSPFMPSTLVFPGGRLDPADGPADQDRGWEQAARRESLEEACLDLRDRDLRWFDTWLTPSGEGIRRYLTRFYAVQLQSGEGDEARTDGVETHEGRWATAQQLLGDWTAETIDLPIPTLTVLLRLQPLVAGELDRLLQGDPRDPILPKVTHEGNTPVIVLPHHADYVGLPGDSAPAPVRAMGLPSRFERKGNRWQPC